MRDILGKTLSHPVLSLGSVLLWGIIEFLALQRSRLAGWGGRGKPHAQ